MAKQNSNFSNYFKNFDHKNFLEKSVVPLKRKPCKKQIPALLEDASEVINKI